VAKKYSVNLLNSVARDYANELKTFFEKAYFFDHALSRKLSDGLSLKDALLFGQLA